MENAWCSLRTIIDILDFLLVLLFYLKEADNDQQGQIGNGDEHVCGFES